MAWLQNRFISFSEMWSTDKKYTVFGLFVLCVYFMWMDVALYNCIQDMHLNLPSKSSTMSSPYDAKPSFKPFQLYSPFNDHNIKSIMIDPGNHYIHIPLAVMFNNIANLSNTWKYITPNMITIFHFIVAVVAGKIVTSESLTTRRFAVLLFEFRTWLDALDGVVYRSRTSKEVSSSKAHPSSLGYYLDGVSDIMGTTAFIIGCLIFLKKSLARKANSQYLPLSTNKFSSENSDCSVQSHSNNQPISTRRIFFVLLCFGGQLMISLRFWDRYVFSFQELLESPTENTQFAIGQNKVIKSALMWIVMWFWRLANAHALTEMLLVSVFLDKLWEFVLAVQYLGFVALFTLISVSEMQLNSVKSYLRQF